MLPPGMRIGPYRPAPGNCADFKLFMLENRTEIQMTSCTFFVLELLAKIHFSVAPAKAGDRKRPKLLLRAMRVLERSLLIHARYMLAKVYSGAIHGVDAYLVEVEIDMAIGLPAFNTVGLPEGAVRESKERVRAAIKNSGFEFPPKRVTVNLAPADIRKDGSSLDLPTSIGILAATSQVREERLKDYLILGELSLDGRIKGIKGALPAAAAARDLGVSGIIVPKENVGEASVVEGIEALGARSLHEVVRHLNGEDPLSRTARPPPARRVNDCEIDLSDVKGQEHAKRALEVAAAGGHNILMIGPPGSGKSMIAKRLSTILPEMSFDEALETSKVYSVVGLMPNGEALVGARPFRAPHHTVSDAGLVGGGAIPKPGEASLAHNGVLFLDELPEFRKNVLDVLRQPIEDERITLARAATTITYPARFMLVAAMNPCQCGYFGDSRRPCHCSPLQVQRYRTRVSGPLLDRIDIQIEVPAVPYKELASERRGEPSRKVRERVEEARRIQQRRLGPTKSNARMTPRQFREHCRIDRDGHRLLEAAVNRLGLSARAFDRILKVARTVADLEGSPAVTAPHLSEAVQYRSFDRAVG